MALLDEMRRQWMELSGPKVICPTCGKPRWVVDKYLACEGGCRLVWIEPSDRHDLRERRVRLRKVAAVLKRWAECGFISGERRGW